MTVCPPELLEVLEALEAPEAPDVPEIPNVPNVPDDIDIIDICIIRDTKEILKVFFIRLLTNDEMERLCDILFEYRMTDDEYFEMVESYISIDNPLSVIYETIDSIANTPLPADF